MEGPAPVVQIIANGTNYTDTSFTGKDMVWWEGDNLPAPYYSYYLDELNSGEFIFRDWTNYLPSTTDLFYANGTISFSQIKPYGYFEATL